MYACGPRKKSSHFKLFMNGVAIPQTCGLKYLGVYIQSDLKCHGHTMNTVKKGNRLLAMIRRCLFSASTKTKMIAFNTVVWPVLEYASQVWSPYIKTIIDKVETVQRRAVKWAYRLGPVESVSECMIKNNIEQLKEKRQHLDLNFLKRIEFGLYEVGIAY